MKKKIYFLLILSCLLNGYSLWAQQSSSDNDSITISFKPYASFRGHFALYNGELEMQENGSRIGMELVAKRRNISFFTGIELQINMFRSQSVFNANTNTSGGYIVASNSQDRQVFSTRLGYIGADLGKGGLITIGKQNSVYYDITYWTDKFNVFGAGASATFVGGTDGGTTGTGRADQALIYRNKIGPVSVGVQLQFLSAQNNEFLDGFGVSLRGNVIPNLQIGAAYDRAYLNPSLIQNGNVIGFDKQPGYFTAGATYLTKKLEVGFVYAHQTNGDLTDGKLVDSAQGVSFPSVVFDATGWELYVKRNWRKLSLLGGFNYYLPQKGVTTASGQQPLDPGFKRKYFILGGEYRPFGAARIYTELRIAGGTTALGTNELSVFTLGLRLDFDHTFSKNFIYKPTL